MSKLEYALWEFKQSLVSTAALRIGENAVGFYKVLDKWILLCLTARDNQKMGHWGKECYDSLLMSPGHLVLNNYT